MSEPEDKLCNEPVADTATPPFEPSWEKFCESMHDQTGKIVPDQTNPQWRQYYNCWAVGYLAALRGVLKFARWA